MVKTTNVPQNNYGCFWKCYLKNTLVWIKIISFDLYKNEGG